MEYSAFLKLCTIISETGYIPSDINETSIAGKFVLWDIIV